LAAAQESRRRRLAVKEQLKSGAIDVADVFAMADGGDATVAGMRVAEALRACPGIGTVRARRILDTAAVADKRRRIRGLGARQRAAIVAEVSGKPRVV
jgi:hypothetical protein